ncbi:MAG: ribosome maturation factor [Saprospiraceae bacterium]|nr:ribosome maturation factor [Saprospiraceae bacterium]MBP7680017.1 ribosome maturation factor [Saprospiraceae bacterium]
MVVTIGIEELLLQKFEQPAFSDCFIVEIKLANPNRLEVFVDSDTGISLEKCQKISRYLEQHLEEKKWLSENYTLEVSSPGINRPLKFVRQYKKNIGRTLDITLSDNTIKKGVLLNADDEQILIEETLKVKEGKKNVSIQQQTQIPYTAIAKAIVKISFA